MANAEPAQKAATTSVIEDPSDEAGPDGRSIDEADAPPRPPTNDEIIAMMDAAAAEAKSRQKPKDATSFWDMASFSALWAGIFVAIASIFLVVMSAQAAGGAGLVLAGGLALVMALFLCGAAMRMFSPMLMTGALLRRATGRPAAEAAELAGAEILESLGLAERVLDVDEDARVVTRRDGVVTYANNAYMELSREAGVSGPAGLPPRIDRLFAQQGAEATKIFRLCRAAKSGLFAEETIYQVMGLTGGGRRRRFDVSVRPIRGSDDYVSWILREQPAEDEQDFLATAYAEFPEAVFALEQSGQIAWCNNAMRRLLGADESGVHNIKEFVLGETDGVVRALWKFDDADVTAMVRRGAAEPAEAAMTAFRRGGVGEGFACVALKLEDAPISDEASANLSGDLNEAPFGVAVIDGEFGKDSKITEANAAFSEVFGGGKKNALLSKSLSAAVLEELAAETRRKSKSAQVTAPVEASVKTKEGGERTYALYARPGPRRRGSYGARRTLLYSVDVTDRKQMQEEHAQDQKLKSIGQLASKVAHDYNNYLQAVLGHCERLMLRHPAGDPAYQELVQIRENAQRAANVTKQLLAFSRKQTLTREVQSITEILRDFSRFLDRSIGEKVSLELINGRGLPPIKVDRFQLETAIMNIAVNARDAMAPKGGKLTITTKLVPAHEIGECAAAGLVEEDHVLIDITDTGPGVPQEIADKIFDPFFTTKDIGKGTGLGLSTVHGVIGQMGGAITLTSEPGKGASFKIFLPAYEGEVEESKTPPPQQQRSEPSDLTGDGRILIVEDEDAVRNFVIATLKDCGYEVVAAEDGEAALEIFEEEGASFDLVLTDVMMPVLDGPSMIQEAREKFGLKAEVIFMSGYAEAAVREQLDAVTGAGYIQKPFTLQSIAAQVKQKLSPPDSDS